MKVLIFAVLFFYFQGAFAASTTIKTCDPQIAETLPYDPTPVYAPGTPKLPFTCDGKVKVFEITAEEVFSIFDEKYEAGPIYTWGYNGSNPGPVMELIEGETVRVIFKNKLPESTTLHWHGLEVPYGQDGVPGHSQNPVMPGMGFTYQWKAEQAGTFMYHSSQNLAKQLSMGLVGFLIIHPKDKPETLVDHDILLFLQMWAIPSHSILPDPMAMMFNYFTMNGKASPYIPSPTIYVGQKARIRFANMSMAEHPVHLHGHTWRVVATGAGDNPTSTHTLGNTILVPTAQTMDVIIDEVKTPGEWMFHCHLPHHVTNNMDIEPIPGEPMDMDNGGMHIIMNVHKSPGVPGYENPTPPPGGGHGGGHGGHGAAAPSFTTYDGYIKLKNGKRIDASLELFKVQEDQDWRKAQAFLKVFLSEDEFITIKYEKMNFNFESGLFNFESADKSISLSNLSFMDHAGMGMISGEVSIDFGTSVAELKLNARNESRNDIKLKYNTSISGEYSAVCNDQEKLLQITTSRAMMSSEGNSTNPIANFLTSGVIGTKNGPISQVESFISEVFYNPFESTVNLKINTNGAIEVVSCNTTFTGNRLTGLNCNNSCYYEKQSEKQLSESNLKFQENKFIEDKSSLVTELDKPEVFTGLYKGIVNLKNNQSMALKLQIVGKKFANNAMSLTKNFISGTIALLIADKEMVYKIKQRPYLNSSSPINNNKNLLLLETHDKVSVTISKWTRMQIEGELYHQDYGLLGAFAVNKSIPNYIDIVKKESVKNVTLTTPLEGVFSSENWQLSLQTSQIEASSQSSVFTPLHLKGSLKSNDGFLKISIIDGSYDFAIKTFYLKTDDGRILKGKVKEEEIILTIPSKFTRRAKYLNLHDSTFTLKKVLAL